MIGFVAKELPWLWMLLLVQVIFAWFLEVEQRDFQRLIIAIVDRVAQRKGLYKIDKEAKRQAAARKAASA